MSSCNSMAAAAGTSRWRRTAATSAITPPGDTAVIAHLEALRARGADHLLLPATTLWWLDHYQGLRRHLDDHYMSLVADEHCAIYRLRAPDMGRASRPAHAARAHGRQRHGCAPAAIPRSSTGAPGSGFATASRTCWCSHRPPTRDVLPYLDRTVDIVVLASASSARLAEARRAATSAVITVDPGNPERGEVEWSAERVRRLGGRRECHPDPGRRWRRLGHDPRRRCRDPWRRLRGRTNRGR